VDPLATIASTRTVTRDEVGAAIEAGPRNELSRRPKLGRLPVQMDLVDGLLRIRLQASHRLAARPLDAEQPVLPRTLACGMEPSIREPLPERTSAVTAWPQMN